MRKYLFVTVALWVFVVNSARAQESAADAIYQIATWRSLNAGLYQGFSAIGDLLKRGDFGYGVLAELDGEFLILDGRSYQIRPDGTTEPATATNGVCYAIVKLFDANQSGIRAESLSLAELKSLFDGILQTKNLPIAIKVDGDFASISIAALPEPGVPPPPFVKAEENQTTRILTNVTGTVMGFRLPPFLGEATSAGYRLYFIKRDRTVGGRVMDLRARNIRFDFDYSHRLHLEFPAWGEFYSLP